MYTQRYGSKFGAKRTTFNNRQFDSKYEAGVAQELEIRKKAGDIKDYECQFKIEAWAHRSDGTPAFKVSHKIDFRIHHNDGSYELLEAKGVETADYKMRRKFADYKMRRKFFEYLWLPDHLDHRYSVVKQSRGGWRR